MPALLNDISVLHHQYHIRRSDGGQSVSHHEAGPAFHQSLKIRLDLLLGPGIDGRCRLVKYKHGRNIRHDT